MKTPCARFKGKVQQEDIIKEVKRHSFYLKPGEKRRMKEALVRQAEPQESTQGAGLIIGILGSVLGVNGRGILIERGPDL